MVCMVPSCYPDSASSNQLRGFGRLRLHPYGHPLHRKVFEHFIYLWDGSVIQSEVVNGLNHAIVVGFVPSCYTDSASSFHLQSFSGLRMHPYGHQLHHNVLKHFIYIRWKCNPVWSGSWPQPCHSGMVCTQLLPRFSQLDPPPRILWTKDASIWTSTPL